LATPTTDLAQDFFAKLNALEHTRSKMEELFNQNLIEVHDIERVYSGLVLESFTAFEGLLEDLFLGLLTGTHISPQVKLKVTIQPESAIYELLVGLGKGNYLEWMPYTNVEARAKLFFEDDGKPFTGLNKLKDYLTELYTIRNVIAHQSKFSVEKFEKTFIQNKTLNPNEKTPLGFLRGRHVVSGNKTRMTRYEHYIIQLKAIAQHLCQ